MLHSKIIKIGWFLYSYSKIEGGGHFWGTSYAFNMWHYSFVSNSPDPDCEECELLYAASIEEWATLLHPLISTLRLSHLKNVNFYCAMQQICIARTCYGNVAGWVSVSRRYCIKMAKPILKLFWPSGSPIILVSSDPCTDTQFQGEPIQRGVKYTGGKSWWLSCNFQRKLPFISKTVRDRPMVTMER